MEKLGLNKIRELFLSFYESKGHYRRQSFSLIPEKLRVIVFLQKMNMLRHSGLRNIQFFRCACEIHTLTYS